MPSQFSRDEKLFAAEICKRNKKALSEFQDRFSDELYYIASKFNNRGIPQDSWEYRTKKGYSIYVSDDVSDTYVWLINIAINKSCLYRGDHGASFATYIISVLNSNYTFKDWLKWKTGVTGYVPKCIKALTKDHVKIFTLLRQKKQDEIICEKLKLTMDNYLIIYTEIESALIGSNQIDLIDNPKFISIDNSFYDNENEDSYGLQLPSKEYMNPDDQPDYIVIKKIAASITKELTDAERRLLLLYWGEKLSVSEIYYTFSFGGFQEYLGNLSIEQAKDIYRVINQLIKKSLKIVSELFPNEKTDYDLNERKIKVLLKNFYHNFEI